MKIYNKIIHKLETCKLARKAGIFIFSRESVKIHNSFQEASKLYCYPKRVQRAACKINCGERLHAHKVLFFWRKKKDLILPCGVYCSVDFNNKKRCFCCYTSFLIIITITLHYSGKSSKFCFGVRLILEVKAAPTSNPVFFVVCPATTSYCNKHTYTSV